LKNYSRKSLKEQLRSYMEKFDLSDAYYDNIVLNKLI
jgi:hypothetical protein